MKKSFLFIALLFFLNACGQKNMYDLSDYKEVQKGTLLIDGVPWPNSVFLQNKLDSNYLVKITYTDSTYKTIATKFFYYKNVADGPYKSYVDGKLFTKGYNKNGKRDGERIVYGEKFLRGKEYYSNGTKIGVWEEYDDKGKLVERTYYKNGSVEKTEHLKKD